MSRLQISRICGPQYSCIRNSCAPASIMSMTYSIGPFLLADEAFCHSQAQAPSSPARLGIRGCGSGAQMQALKLDALILARHAKCLNLINNRLLQSSISHKLNCWWGSRFSLWAPAAHQNISSNSAPVLHSVDNHCVVVVNNAMRSNTLSAYRHEAPDIILQYRG